MSALPDTVGRDRERLRRAIELVPDRDVPVLLRVADALATEYVCASLDEALDDDEPVTPEDVEAQAEARADVAAGRVYSHEEAKRLILSDLSQ